MFLHRTDTPQVHLLGCTTGAKLHALWSQYVVQGWPWKPLARTVTAAPLDYGRLCRHMRFTKGCEERSTLPCSYTFAVP